MTKTKSSLRRQSRGGGFMEELTPSKIINFLNTLTKVALLVIAAIASTMEGEEKEISPLLSMYLTAVQLRQSDMGKGNLDLAETLVHIVLSVILIKDNSELLKLWTISYKSKTDPGKTQVSTESKL